MGGGETKGKAEITNVGNKSCRGSGGETRAQSAHWKTASRREKNRRPTSGRLGRDELLQRWNERSDGVGERIEREIEIEKDGEKGTVETVEDAQLFSRTSNGGHKSRAASASFFHPPCSSHIGMCVCVCACFLCFFQFSHFAGEERKEGRKGNVIKARGSGGYAIWIIIERWCMERVRIGGEPCLWSIISKGLGDRNFFPLFFSPLPFLSRRDDDCTSRVRGRDFCFLFFPLNF